MQHYLEELEKRISSNEDFFLVDKLKIQLEEERKISEDAKLRDRSFSMQKISTTHLN